MDDFSTEAVLTSSDNANGIQKYPQKMILSCTDKQRQSDRNPEMSGMDDLSTKVVLTSNDKVWIGPNPAER